MLEVYVKTGCPYCEKQIDVFNRQKVEYKLHNVSEDADALKTAKETYGATKVPLVVEDGTVKSVGFGGGG